MTDIVQQTIDTELETYQSALFSLLRQPSISTTGEGMDTAVDVVVETIDRFGFDHVKSIETCRHPLVYAEKLTDPENPTVVFYGHYDVQPPGADDEWESPPFEPTVRDGRIYARGVGDNKGQFSAHVFATHALSEADELPAVNIKLLVEGGEESGSAGLFEYIDSGAPDISDADLLYVADGPMHAAPATAADTETQRKSVPTFAYGNRGVLSFQLDLQTANTDFHSGNFGGPTPNAATELVHILDSFFTGEDIAIDGFLDGVNPSDRARELVDSIPVDEQQLMDELDITALVTDRGFYHKLLLEPSLTINGLSSGYQGDGMKTVLPSKATAKLDTRLVPGQDPDAVFAAISAHIEARNPDVMVTKQTAFAPMQTPIDAPEADAVRSALSSVWGQSPVEFPVLGGSLPAAYFQNAPSLADIPVFVVPYANHDEGNHSPNENMELACFERGIRTSAAFLQAIADE
ncbi:M20/M25/M40 family metallo-hydrolase [Natronocalculus amylovorans]|uniref:M20/M25/M40 family metallo-hydrolase n=1 Tax=Natronocalculus amylovorans TaxID=2917812 RepID=A0AAE3K7J2_9EURY|nr:M20/M25/M40 family metallo-hydrolase [Natronocalculus amylovorans]MCL9815515.1 M20/M25/M40 family metallo-hydrolase [Natronocalculus amylovorans]